MPRKLIVEDQTFKFCGPWNNVPPHVDGKDGTFFVCSLNGKFCKHVERMANLYQLSS